MSVERFQRVRAAFDTAVDLRPEERRAAIVRVVGGDRQLVAEVEALLARLEEVDTDALVPRPAARVETGAPEGLAGFEILGELGRGGMGVVWDARQLRPERRVALKTLRADRRVPETVELLVRELQILADVDHPGVPKVLQVFDHDGVPVLVMEHVDGRPVTVALAGAELRAQVAALRQVAEVVAHVHAAGVVHRDLTPSNLLVTAAGRIVVLDFGIAAARAVEGPPGSGTVAYAAPEQLRGLPADARADVYALGVVGRELLGTSLPADLRAVLGRATANHPDDRYPTMVAFADDLGRVLADRPVSALQGLTALGPPLARRAWAARWVGVGGVGALVLGLLGRAAWGWRQEAEASRLVAAADPAEIDALLVSDTLRGTRALSAAWLRAAAARVGEDRRVALAQAWVSSADDEAELAALRALVPELDAAREWWALDAVLQRLPDDELPGERMRAALARVDLTEAARHAPLPLSTTLARLAHARPGPPRLSCARWLPGGQALLGSDRGLTWVVGDVEVRTWALPGAVEQIEHDAGVAWLRVAGPEHPELWRVELEGNSPPTHVDPDWRPVDLMLQDVDGDGIVERYVVAENAPALGVAEPADQALTPLYTPLSAPGPKAVGAGDVDGDGQQDVVVASWGTRTRDVRALAGVPSDARPLWRLRFRASAAQVIGGRVVAVGEGLASESPSAVPIPPAPVLAWARPDGLPELVSPLTTAARRLRGADLDGDGQPDVVLWLPERIHPYAGEPPGALGLVHRQGEETQQAWLPGYDLLDLAEGPGGALLWMRDTVSGRSWVQGDVRDPLEGLALPRPNPLRGDDPEARARALVEVGLAAEGAEVLASLAALPDPRHTAMRAEAARLLEPGHLERAVQIARSALGRPGLTAADGAALADLLTHAHDVEGLALVPPEFVPDALRPVLAAARLEVEETFALPVRLPWTVLAPEAVRRDALAGALEIRATRATGDLLSLPLLGSGRVYGVTLDVEVVGIDWGSGLAVELRGAGGSARVQLWRVGGEPVQDQALAASGEPFSSVLQPGSWVGAHTLAWSLVRSSEGGVPSARLWLDGVASLPVPGVDPGVNPRLVLRTGGTGDEDGLVHMRVRSIRLTGVTVAPGPSEGVEWLEDLTAPAGSGRAGAVIAARSGRADSVDLTALSPADHRFLLRVDPSTWQPRLRSVLGSAFAPTWVDAWESLLVYREPAADEAALALVGLAPADPAAWPILQARARGLIDAGRLLEAEALLAVLRDTAEPAGAWEITARLRAAQGDRAGAATALSAWLACAPERARDAAADDVLLAPILAEVARPDPVVWPLATR